MKKKLIIGLLLMIMTTILVGCGLGGTKSSSSDAHSSVTKVYNKSDIFTERDLEQTIDTTDATEYIVSDGKDITITEEGTYVFSGSAKNVSIIVNADDETKVNIVLSNVTIENETTPCIYIKNADKVFVNMVGSNKLTVSNTFTKDGTTNTDAVIFSKDDIVINGSGSLNISSSNNGITGKDDLKITGGTININCLNDALEANNSIAILAGDITINSKKDGLHAEYSDDDSVGYVYISGGTIEITASDDAIHATTVIQIDGGNIITNAREGLEGTYVQINDGTLNITATDDGINAGSKSKSYSVKIEINGGSVTIDMGQGDTDAIDSNGDLYITGGTLNITAQSPFDYDGNAEYTGGKIVVNGKTVTQITNQMMGDAARGQRR